jgi:hypothetical protein
MPEHGDVTDAKASRMDCTPSGTTQPPVGRSVRFDWAIVVLWGWLLGGLYVDGWAHNHLATTLESFLTPWHAAFSSGFLPVAGVTEIARPSGMIGPQ